MRLITESNRDWVVEGLNGSATHRSDAPFAVLSLHAESSHPVRQYLGGWSVVGCAIGGFLVSAGVGATDAAAATVLVVTGLIVLLLCGTAGWVVLRTARAVHDALQWWAEQDDALAPHRSWRRAGVLSVLTGVVTALVALGAWFATALALATADLSMLPFALATAVSFNVAAVTVLRHALRRSRVAPRALPDVEAA